MNCNCGPGYCWPSGTEVVAFRRYESKAEKRDRLAAYANELEHELAAVKERLGDLQAA